MRIRSIKPEMLSDQKIASLSHDEFRCFIGLLLLADDYGNARAAPNYIAGQIFWAAREPVSVNEILARLSRESLVILYEINSQAYLHVCGWSKHQKVVHPGKPWVPPPPDSPQEVKEILFTDQGSKDLRIKDQGSDPEQTLVPLEAGRPSLLQFAVDLDSVADHYAMFHPRAKPGQKERRLIRDRLKEKYTVDDLRRAIDGYHISPFHCGINDKATTYLGMSLIFRDSSHVQKGIELAEKGVPKTMSERSLRAKFAVESFLAMGKPKL